MLQESLKQATRDCHTRLEQLMYVDNIMNGALTTDEYRHILVTNFIVHQVFEETLFNGLSAQLAARLGIGGRRKLKALQEDLREMRLPEPESSQKDVSFNSEAEILGALYVLEGATLGGSVIVRRLMVNPNFVTPALSFRYYRVYGDDLMSRWKTFCAILNEQPAEFETECISGAKKMFACIESVIREMKEAPTYAGASNFTH